MVTKTIELEAKTDKAVKELEDLRKEVQRLQNTVQEGNQQTQEGLDDVKKSGASAAKSLKGIGTAIKAIGIGLLLEAFNFFKETIGENQKAVDLFNTVFEAMSLAFNDFINFISDNWSKATKPVSDFFNTEAVGKIKEFGKILAVEVITRVKNLVEGIGGLGKALVKVFKGDFKGAADEAKGALENFKDTLIGNAEETAKVEVVFDKVTKKVSNYVKETIKGAKANTELQKTAEVARVVQQGLVEQYDRQAEKLRQTRDEERNTIKDRIKANNDLKSVLDEQEEAMLKQVDLQIASAQAQYDKNGNQENYIALLEATQEREAVLAQIEGFRSEQKMNDLALSRELIELEETQAEGKIERRIAEQEFLAEQIEGEYLRLEALQTVALEEARLEEERLTKKRDLYQKGTQAYVDANEELLNFQSENNQKQLELDKQLQESKATLITGALNNIASIVGKNSKFGKAIAIVQAIRDTYAGANKALSSAPPPFNFISAAATVAAGIANVRQIAKTQEPQAPAGVSTGGGTSAPASIPPAFNVIGQTGTNQLAEAIAGQTQKPVRAYVVSNEVTSAQSLDRNIVSEATL